MSIEYRELVKRIPAEIIDKILTENIVSQAQGINEYMKYLFEIWYLYVDPNGNRNWECPLCRENIKSNFIELLPSFIEANKQSKLLDAL